MELPATLPQCNTAQGRVNTVLERAPELTIEKIKQKHVTLYPIYMQYRTERALAAVLDIGAVEQGHIDSTRTHSQIKVLQAVPWS